MYTSIELCDLKTIVSKHAHLLMIRISFWIWSYSTVVAADERAKRQSDDEDVDPLNTDELCQDRPADEYFRTTTEGDCRDVVR